MKTKTSSRFRTWLALALAPLSGTAAESAQPGLAADETVKLEAFTVTGSNIRRQDAEKTLPVTTTGRPETETAPPGEPETPERRLVRNVHAAIVSAEAAATGG